MSKVTREYRFSPGEKLSKRWEAQWPDLRCVMVQDPDYGGDHKQVSHYMRLGYRKVDEANATDDSRFAFMDSNIYLLMGKDRKKWEEDEAERAKIHPTISREEVLS